MSLGVGVGVLRGRGSGTWVGADVVSSSQGGGEGDKTALLQGGGEGDKTALLLVLVYLVCLLGGIPTAES